MRSPTSFGGRRFASTVCPKMKIPQTTATLVHVPYCNAASATDKAKQSPRPLRQRLREPRSADRVQEPIRGRRQIKRFRNKLRGSDRPALDHEQIPRASDRFPVPAGGSCRQNLSEDRRRSKPASRANRGLERRRPRE